MYTKHRPSSWHTFWSIVRAYERRNDLVRLTCWAQRKRLPGPLRCYQNRLVDEEARLFRHQLQRPDAALVARCVYHLERFFVPRSRRHRRGAAARYSSHGQGARRD